MNVRFRAITSERRFESTWGATEEVIVRIPKRLVEDDDIVIRVLQGYNFEESEQVMSVASKDESVRMRAVFPSN